MKKNQPQLVKLRDSAEMFQRLLAVDEDQHLREKFYPHLLSRSEARMTADQAAETLAQAIREYYDDRGERRVARHLVCRADRYLSAMLEDDKSAMQARACFNTFLALAFFPQPQQRP